MDQQMQFAHQLDSQSCAKWHRMMQLKKTLEHVIGQDFAIPHTTFADEQSGKRKVPYSLLLQCGSENILKV